MHAALSKKDEAPTEELHKAATPPKQALEPEAVQAQRSSKKDVATIVQSQPELKKEDRGLSSPLQKIEQGLEDCKTLRHEERTKSISQLYSDLTQLESELDFGYRNASVENLMLLKKLKTELESEGKRLLQSAFLTENFKEATQLKSFNNVLSNSIIDFALSKNKPKLLEFLMANGIARSDYEHFEIQKSHYSSMIDFCFKEHTAENSKMDLLLVLIKNGCSLMQLDSQSNLPFIAILLMQPDHPLREVLRRDESNLFHNAIFYRKLNKVLHLLLSQPNCSAERKEKIEALIQSNLHTIRDLEVVKSVSISPAFSKQISEFQEQAKEGFDKQLIHQLKADPDIQKKNALLQSKTEIYIKKLPLNQRRAIKEQTSINMDALLKGSLYDISGYNYGDLKELVLKQCIKSIGLIELGERLLEVQNERKKPNSRKKAQKLEKEEREIISEINSLSPNFLLNLQEKLHSLLGVMNKTLSMLNMARPFFASANNNSLPTLAHAEQAEELISNELNLFKPN
ncbi:hypothetical protein BN59_02417 [Legionella massiliensis]|uniref:Uncharacterized protein n=2 Tax=Legionella massiliensis TaxID=1034943 RepID=A0A078KUI4_9GAMM|nr:hypothetical protein BN59_02417 [Legionella massiliensis]CEE13848.1 hypothetical protein BN1094_02417 [Legionella massiliensis]